MKIQTLAVLALAASLFAQEAVPVSIPVVTRDAPIPCREAFDAIKGTSLRDAAADRMAASVEARISTLEKIPKDERKGTQYSTELRNCDLSVELLKTQFERVALQKSLDSINKGNIALQKELSMVKDSLIVLWSGEALGAKSDVASLSDERARLERLNLEKAMELAIKDSLLAVQKAEAERRLSALHSRAINVYKDARGTILSMSDILFETGRADLKPELRENLSAIGAILQSLLTESEVTVEGHTDNVGTAEFNQRLSEQRANAVMQYLIERGINAERLEAVGYGFSRPVADNETDEGRARNRRVELVIKDS
jgi:outer membrane protein OmpA-like peptidoglycan-associated protein